MNSPKSLTEQKVIRPWTTCIAGWSFTPGWPEVALKRTLLRGEVELNNEVLRRMTNLNFILSPIGSEWGFLSPIIPLPYGGQ